MSLSLFLIFLYFADFLFSFIKLFIVVAWFSHCFFFFLKFSLSLLGCLPCWGLQELASGSPSWGLQSGMM